MGKQGWTVALVSGVLMLSGCGGGSPSSDNNLVQIPTLNPPPTPAPVVSVSISKTKAQVGETAVLTWSSTNTTTCAGMDSAVAGTKSTAGSETVTATTGGQFKYTISCDGPGGTAKQFANFIVPYPVLKTSYANKNRFEITDTIMPDAWKTNLEGPTSGFFHNRPFGVADFTQEGKFSVMAFQTQFSSTAQKAKGFADLPNKAFILQRNEAGNYVDITERLIPNAADRVVCITPTYAIVADFNKDTKPDVFVACTGLDFPTNGVWPDGRTEQYAYISQTDGTYKQWKSSFKAYGHQCSAGDISGDSNVDVVCVDSGRRPFTLIGDGKGSFDRDDTRFPNLDGKSIFGIELVDLGTGLLDVFLGGVTEGADPFPSLQYNNVFIKNNGNGYFNVNTPLVIPTSLAPKMVAKGNNYTYSAFHDIVINNEYVYLLQYDYLYSSMIIRKVNLSNVSDNQIIFENINGFTGYMQVVSLMKPTADGFIVPIQTCQFERTEPSFASSVCGVKVKM
jgi:hypothetical protein